MDRLAALQLFNRIVECGSFSRAAASMGIPRATATHAIKELETRLGARLLERTTRQVRPTLDGQAFHRRCVLVLAELEDAESALRHVASSPRGVLRLDMHGSHATRIVLPRIDEFRALYPDMDLVVGSGDRLVDLVGEGVDCVIRGGLPRDSSLVAKRLANMPQLLCASPAYLAKFGRPSHPDALPEHRTVRFLSAGGASEFPIEMFVDGSLKTYALGGWVAVSDAENYVACGLRGCGLIQLPRYRAEEDLAAGRLEEVLPGWASPSLPVSALYPQHRQLSTRVRVFIDWVSGVYRDCFGPLG